MAEPSASEMIRRMLVVSFGVEGAEEVIRALVDVDNAAQQVQRQTTKTGRSFAGLGKFVGHASTAITTLGATFTAFKFALRELGIDGAKNELYQYNKELVASRVVFARLGEGVQTTEKRMFELQEKFAFSRQELLQLQKQIQLGFNTITVDQMGDYMQLLADATGESADEMMRLDGVLQRVSGKLPLFQEILKGSRESLETVGRDMLEASALLGKIDVATYKEASGFITAQQNRRLGGTAREDDARTDMQTVRRAAVAAEEMKITAQDKMLPLMEEMTDFAWSNLNELKSIGGWLIVATQAISAISSVGMTATALRLLRGTALAAGGSSAARAAVAGASAAAGTAAASRAASAGRAALAGRAVLRGGARVAAMGARVATAAAPVAAPVATAIGSFMAGEKLYRVISGVDKTLDEVNKTTTKLTKEKVEAVSKKYAGIEGGEGMVERAEEIAQLEQQLAEKETENLKGPIDAFRNLWSDPRDRAKEQLSSEMKRLEELRKTQSEEAKKIEARRKQEIQAERMIALQAIIRHSIEVQSNLLDSIVGKYQTSLDLLSKFGGINIFGSNLGQELESVIDQTFRLIDAQSIAENNITSAINNIRSTGDASGYENILETLEQARENGVHISDDIFEMLVDQVAPIEVIAELEAERLRLQTAQKQGLGRISDSLNEVTRSREGELRRASAMTSLLATQVSLADNLAMGVGASAQMRFEQVEALQREIEIMREQQAISMQSEQQAVERLRARGASEEEVRAVIYQAQTQRLEIEDKILQKQQQQASVTRTIRDGWVSAISAMMTGNGMFTKIVVDQNKRVGMMMSATENATTGLRTGFSGRGFTESQKYTVGGISGSNDGVTDAWGNALTSSSPLSGYGGSIRAADASKAVSEWQESTGRHQDTGAAGAGGARYGTSELLEQIKDGVQRPTVLQTDGPPLPVQVTNSAQKVEISVTPQDMKTMVEELIKQFTMVMKTVTEAAQDKVMEEMNTRR